MTQSQSEPTTVGLSEEGRAALQNLVTSKVFLKLLDAYRFAVALGLSHGAYEDRDLARQTMFNVGTIDPDGSLRAATELMRDDLEEPIYRSLERYAEWGARELVRAHPTGEISFTAWLIEAAEHRS